MLTTTEAAATACVAPSTIKRWSDQGLLPFSRTAGGHRRFERFDIERLLQAQRAPAAAGDTVTTEWVRRLVGGRRHEIDSALLESRGRLGSWWRVADELALALVEMGAQWKCDRLSIADEHVASNALAHSLTRIGDALPTRLDGPTCVLACAGKDEHTLGLSLAELCLRELGWSPLWLGRHTPIAEVVRLVHGGRCSLVALSASAVLAGRRTLQATADEVAAACRSTSAGLVLGGSGAWPDRPAFGIRLRSFAGFHDYIAERMRQVGA